MLMRMEYVDAITSHGRDTIEIQIIDSFCYGKGVRAVEGMTWDIRYKQEQDNTDALAPAFKNLFPKAYDNMLGRDK